MAAFDEGLSLGADGLELDVHLSRDGVPIVHHDRTLDRTTNGRGPVAALTADELSRVDAGFAFRSGDAYPFRGCGLGVPTLAEVLGRYRDVPIVIELKLNTDDMALAVVDVVRRAGAIERVCLGSFGRRVLRCVRALEPAIATSAAREEIRWALYWSWCRWPLGRPTYACFQVPEWSGRTRVVSPRFVRMAHRAGVAVQVWTVNSEADAHRLLAWDVDALISDRPDIVVPVCRSHQR